MRIAICDDEKQERQTIMSWLLQENVAKHDIGEYASADDLLNAIHRGEIFQLIYLDIEMPGECNGLDAAQILAKENNPAMLVFITGHREFINQGYKVAAMDFLVKPIEQAEFGQTFKRCKNKYDAQNYLLFEKRDDLLQIKASDIVVITARKNYVEISYCGGQQPFEYRATMAEMEKRLSSQGFFRCHMSYIINLNYLDQVYHEGNHYYAYLSAGEKNYKVAVAQNKWAELKRALHEYRRGYLL